MSYDLTSDYHLNRAQDNIRQAQQVHKHELEERDEIIQALRKKVEVLQSECRNQSESKQLSERETRDFLSKYNFMTRQLSTEQTENERSKAEVIRLKQELKSQIDKLTHLEGEHEKAKYIIRQLLSSKRKQVA